jgi:bifunctional UDP-N-acetylglucosamine pyrophosphorylase / glucosamine-1-phosphate N-acetyltransferase
MTGCVILAAGQGKRMKSPLPKVVHPVLGVPMVLRVLGQARAAGMDDPVVVVGHGREHVIPLLEKEGASWAVQEQQLGTAHAVQCGLGDLNSESVTVLLGDVPLLKSGTIADLEERRKEAGAAVAVLTTYPPDPGGYGRVVREGRLLKAIVEHRDCTEEQLEIGEINTGLMSFDGSLLRGILAEIDSNNDQQEYYLTDAIAISVSRGYDCIAVVASDHVEVSGVNNRVQLAVATEHARNEVNRKHMLDGVDIPDPGSVWIEESVRIGRGVSIGRCARLSGDTSIGDDCIIGDFSIVVDSHLPGGSRLAPFSVRGPEDSP